MSGYFNAMFKTRKKVGGLLSIAVLLSSFLYAFTLHLQKYLYVYINANWLDPDHILVKILNVDYALNTIMVYASMFTAAALGCYVLYRRRVERFGAEASFWEAIPMRPFEKILVRLLFDWLWAAVIILLVFLIQFGCESMFNMTDRYSMAMVLGMWADTTLCALAAILTTDVLLEVFKKIPSDFLAIGLNVLIAYNVAIIYLAIISKRVPWVLGHLILAGIIGILFTVEYRFNSKANRRQIS